MNTSSTQPFLSSTGPYIHIARMVVIGLIVLSVSRLGLVALFYDRVAATDELFNIFIQGVRADIILMSILAAIPILLSLLFAGPLTHKVWFKFTYLWALVGLCVVVFLELTTPMFIQQYDIRPNLLFVEYLKYPKEVCSMLWVGFKGAIVGVTIGGVIAYIAAKRILAVPQSMQHSWSLKKRLLIWPLCVFLAFAGIRSTTEHRPANPSLFAITADSMVNSIVINSGYSLIYALYNLRHESESSDIYGELPIDEMTQLTRDWPWLQHYQYDSEQPTLHFQPATIERETPPNIVIILHESLGATFVGSLGGVPVTPELEKLKSEGMWFDNLYATGTRSVRGIEAVIAGFMPTPAQSTVKLSGSQRDFSTLASILAPHGYHTQFIYGGEAHFDSMRSFFTGNGFAQVIDLPDITSPVFVGSWGASDEDLFNTAHDNFVELNQAGQPFFSLVFTSSNHEPFEFPDDRIELYEQPKATANNAVKYADWAMGQFFQQAKASEYWDNTIFLVVADHDNRVYGSNLIPVEKFRIPGVIVGGPIEPEVIEPVASQIDLAPTLLSLAGISTCHVMDGRDFTLDKHSPGRALLQFETLFALMQEQELTILRPDSTPLHAHYEKDAKTLNLTDKGISEEEYKRALAHVQLPSYLYRQKLYHPASDCAHSGI
ncbi:LTA synthase family protein [Alteromonas facilis]|uniref:LTA synthase family protein n=1 Tax=Alteromonas facilis TaxID=2048004 RepID=UPI00196A47ED|nr:LTA synthase family protein [Alteromonas facilis]